MLVYLNDTLLGPETNVSTNGSVANFDRDLGQLNVGDTIWVMIDPLKSQSYDAFKNFDFSLQKAVQMATMGMASFSLRAAVVAGTEFGRAACSRRWSGCGLPWRRRIAFSMLDRYHVPLVLRRMTAA